MIRLSFGCILVAGAMLSSTLAAAQEVAGDQLVRQQFEIAGVAAPACLIGVGAAGDVANASFVTDGASGGTVSFTALVDPDTAQANAASAAIVLPVICNSAHNVSVTSANGGLQRVGGARASLGDFEQFIAYRVGYSWVGQDVAGASYDAAGLSLSVPSPGQGDFTVAINLDQTEAPLVAGNYEDILLIEISAAN
jgi:hypothetical protein